MHKKNLIQTLLALLTFAFLACTPKNEVLYESKNSAPQTTKPAPIQKESSPYYVFQNGSFQEAELDKKPLPVGGETQFLMTMYRKMRYPAEARKNGIQGTVKVTVILNEFGQLESAVVAEGIGAGCDEEALEAVKRGFQEGFEPAMKDGKAVKVKYNIPVKFKLE